MRKLLDELYESIRSCEVEKIKNEKEIEKIKNEIEEVTISLNSSNNLSKLEKSLFLHAKKLLVIKKKYAIIFP